MTPVDEQITANARKWLDTYRKTLEEIPGDIYLPLAIAQRTEQVLCTHPHMRNLYGLVWECTICGGMNR